MSNITLISHYLDVANILTLSVVASFYEDPAPPKISKANKSYPNLWNYEIVEVFLYSTESNKYLQVWICGLSTGLGISKNLNPRVAKILGYLDLF